MSGVYYKCLLVFYLLFVGVKEANAKVFDTLDRVPDQDLISIANSIYIHNIKALSQGDAIRELESLGKMAKKRDNSTLAHYAQFLTGRYYYQHNIWDHDLPGTFFEKASKGDEYPDIFRMQLLHYKGLWYYYGLHNFPVAFEYLLKANAILERIGYKNVPEAEELLYDISNIYYQFGELQKTIYYLSQAIELPVTNTRKRISGLNTLGMCYIESNILDSALLYYNKALALSEQSHDTAWYGVVVGNIGNLYFRKGDTRKALFYYRKDYEISLANDQNASAGNASDGMADIYLSLGMLDSAKIMLDISRPLINLSSDPVPKVALSRNLAKYYDRTGNYKLASAYKDSLLFYKDKVNRIKDAALLEQVKNKTETEAHLENIKLLENEKDRQIWIRNSLIGMACLALIILWQTIRKVRLRQRKDKEIFELKQLKSEEDLHNATLQLKLYVERLKEKNQLIEQFSNEMELLKNDDVPGTSTVEKEDILTRLQDSVILTEDNWVDFRHLFTKVYPNFFIHLQDKYPSLTKAEQRLMSLIRLGFSVNDMASTLGISPDSVRKTKYRLCKKLGIEEQEVLYDIIRQM